jgi:WXXGXW repeat (2 copies)
MRTRIIRITLLAATVALGAAAQGADTVFQRYPPPKPMEELQTDRPTSDAVWQPGYFSNDGGTWVWHRGTWGVPPEGKHVWVPARWLHADRGWYLVPGYWK